MPGLHKIKLLLLSALAAILLPPAAWAINSVTVMADSSMGNVIAEIARNYSSEYQVVVNTSFIPPAIQEAQINEGGSADVLVTPRQPWIDRLKTQGLIDVYSQSLIARNKMALVGPIDSSLKADLKQKFPVAELINHMDGEQGFVLGNPETLMEGVYGKEALRALGAAEYLEPYTLYIKQLDQMFDMVRKHHSYGLFLYSSTVSRSGIRVLDVLPEYSHTPIDYYGVVIAGENMDEARKFLEYLKGPSARKVLRENGFSIH
jgi:molybdate transport system substrate-binding protein